MAKRIAVLSDTHGLLRPEVLSAISGCDAIIHVNTPGGNRQLDRATPTPIPRKSYTLSAGQTPPV